MATKIEWCDETINPIRTIDGGYHCTKISPGCANCYAEKINNRFGNKKPYDNEPIEFVLRESELEKIYRWKKPRRIFVQSMGDLFHEDISFEIVEEIFSIMKEAERHTFMVLTKRPDRMYQFLDWYLERSSDESVGLKHEMPSNIWLGVTAENQAMANKRIPILLQIPAEKRFVSVEPMLGKVNLGFWVQAEHPDNEGYGVNTIKCLDWVICGGETGPKARPMHPDWAEDLKDQCQDAGVPFFFKSWGEWVPVHITKDSDFGQVISDTENPDSKSGVAKVGKKKAGRLLDGREWNEMPE